MSSISTDKLVFFPGDLADSSQIGANNLDGYGIQIGSTVISGTNTSLDVYASLGDGYGNKLASTGGALSVSLTYDTNFGAVGASTLRTAAELGNTTGAIDYNRGASSAQTIRTATNNYDGYGTAISSTVVSGKTGLDVNIIDPITASFTNDTNYGTVGANTLRTASQVGNATGAADFNRGVTGAQTLRVTSNLNDGYANQINSLTTGGATYLNVDVIGNVADASADSGNPVKVGTRVLGGVATATTTGNRADLISDLYRRVYINDSPNIGVAATAVTVSTSAATLIASALGGRRRIMIQNLGTVPVYVGQTGVTTASGFKINASGTLALELGPDVGIFAISGTAGQNVRVLEIA